MNGDRDNLLVHLATRDPAIRHALALLRRSGVSIDQPIALVDRSNAEQVALLPREIATLPPGAQAARTFNPDSPIYVFRGASIPTAYDRAQAADVGRLPYLASVLLHELVHGQERPTATDSARSEYAARVLQADWLREVARRWRAVPPDMLKAADVAAALARSRVR